MIRRLLSLSALLVVSTLITAQAAIAAPPSVELTLRMPDGSIVKTGTSSIVGSTTTYLNEQDAFSPNAAPQGGDEWADDLYCTSGGVLNGFGAGFDGSPNDSFYVTMTVYEGAAPAVSGVGGPGNIIIGPWTFIVPFNTIGVSVGFGGGPVVGPDVWLGVSFSDPTVGLTRHDPPQIGSSNDLFWNVTNGLAQDFGGDPVANFVMSVNIEGANATENTTWGRIKALHR